MKKEIIRISLLLSLVTLSFNGFAQVIKPNRPNIKNTKHKLPNLKNTCKALAVHKNFKNIVNWIEKSDRANVYGYNLEITTVKSGERKYTQPFLPE